MKLINTHIIGTYFDTKLSIFSLALSGTEEGVKSPHKGSKGPGGPKGPQPSTGARRRGADHPKLIEKYIIISLYQYVKFQVFYGV